MSGRIFQINVSNGGVPKKPVREAELTVEGLIGDRQAHRKIHGGPEKALCLFSLERIVQLQSEGHPIYPGSVGENLTVSGIEWAALAPEVRLVIGSEVVVELTIYTPPCLSIAASFVNGEFKRISQKINPGDSRLYARVIQPGRIAVGQSISVLGRVK
jgi:MOSC domain-containing protein YiiM